MAWYVPALLLSYIALSLTLTLSSLPALSSLASTGKGTLARLHSTEAEKSARQAKLADAVKTLLECIGEDPERDGLIKTPERYAKALLWMTKGYEERLPGVFFLPSSIPLPGFSPSRSALPPARR